MRRNPGERKLCPTGGTLTEAGLTARLPFVNSSVQGVGSRSGGCLARKATARRHTIHRPRVLAGMLEQRYPHTTVRTVSNSIWLLIALHLASVHCSGSVLSFMRGEAAHTADTQPRLNLRPLIGILSQPGNPAPLNHSYIAASYIKFVESSGARAVPIQFDLPPAEVKKRFQAINGVLIPGGGARLIPTHHFYDVAAQLVKLAMEANNRGTHFPVHGTCLGFEALAVIASSNTSILSLFDSEDYAAPLYYTEHAKQSRFFSALPDSVVADLQSFPYAMENHQSGVSLRAYEENAGLREDWDVLSLSRDRRGDVYVSTMEAKHYPFTAVQWHPEKNTFEFTRSLHIPHDPDAIAVARAVADYVVSEARLNFHAPENDSQEQNLLIYNYELKYTGKVTYPGEEVDFDEAYIFPPSR